VLQKLTFSTVLLACCWSLPAAAQDAARKSEVPAAISDDAAVKFFESKVRPLLANHCYDCHGPATKAGEADLRLDSREGLLKGGKSGPAIVAGEPSQSLMILAVKHDGAVAMPPKTKLPQDEIDTLVAWVKMGAPWTGAQKTLPATTPMKKPSGWDESARNFWAFQPIRVPEPPDVNEPSWSRTPIDRFVLRQLQAKNLRPASTADRPTLLRRATLALIGLPPTPEELTAFQNDESPAAFERVVDRLLASPRYGERWGRHWLDVVRYADSNGMDDNLAYTDAWRYRDYVISSLNADKPYDRFVQEQLAGDLIAQEEPTRHDELVVANGFLAIGPKMLAEDDPVKQQLDIVDEQLDTTCRVFLGLTVGCARCHDHKFDPLSIEDYYGLAGIFKSTRTMITFRVDSKWNATALGGPEATMRLDDLEQVIDRHDNALVNGNTNRMSEQERAAHTKLLEQAMREYAAIPKAMSVGEGEVGDLEVALRGNHLTRGAKAPRQFPTILAGINQPPMGRSQSGRLELARWITNDQNPLTARVIVNRVWRWHFGQGLVRSVDNFGRLGELPSHPELLDWLAATFIADGWSFKKLHRRIVLSQTWQMSTAWDQTAAQVDPENRLMWHRSRKRMDAEVLRDSLLFASRQLDPAMGGTLVDTKPFQNLGVAGATRKPEVYQGTKRSIYLPVFRSAVYEMFQAFDFPDPALLNGDRATTTVASQALFMLNSWLMNTTVERMADLLLCDKNAADGDRMQNASLQLFGRPAVPEEISEWTDFLNHYQSLPSVAGETAESRRRLAWQGLCRALFASNEFVYVN
jgi:mono/diheme cytochrome c family protein